MSSDSLQITCGDYRLQDFIGEGGIAKVWRARHVTEGVDAAIKIIDPEQKDSDNPQLSNFRKELQAVARLMHPNIVHIYSYGEISERDARHADGKLRAGAPYIAMEYGDAGTLNPGRLTEWRQLKGALLQILQALSYAHARDVIHRDLKPGNILLKTHDNGGVRCKLTDFGLVHGMNPESTRDTRDVFAVAGGTPHYMPPEQFFGEWRKFGPPTDLYALGCMAYEFATGQPPFDAENVFQMAQMHRDEAPPTLEAPIIDVPNGFETWLKRLLAKEPEDRFQLAADARWHLERLDEVEEDTNQLLDCIYLDASEKSSEVPETKALDSATTQAELAKPTLMLDQSETTDPESESDSTEAPETRDMVGVPDIPGDWRRPVEKRRGIRVKGAGLQLFALREPPFVGRVESRNRIWNLLRSVDEISKPKGMMLEGQRGAGKSHLTRWICRRAEETGAARALFAPYGAARGSNTGFSYMFEVFFRVTGLERPDVYEKIREEIADLYPDRRSSDYLDYEAKALTEIVRPTPRSADGEAPAFNFYSLDEQHATILRFLRNLGRVRPVIVWMDNLHWSKEGLDFIDYLFQSNEGEEADFPGLFLMTHEQLQNVEEPVRVERLEALQSVDEIETTRVEPLTEDKQSSLLDQLLRLSDETKDRLLNHVDGRPLFTVQVLEDWIERNALEFNGRGRLELTEDVGFPANFSELWLQRVERLLDAMPNELREQQRMALEIASALGIRVNEREWELICEKWNIEIFAGLVDKLVESGFVSRHRNGWTFRHDLLRESLERSAKEAGRWSDYNCTAAWALGEIYDSPSVNIKERRTKHFVEGNDFRKALQPLFEAIERAQHAGDYEKAETLIEKRSEIIEHIDDPDLTDRVRYQNNLFRANLGRSQGDSQAAAELVEEVIEEIEKDGVLYELGRAYSVKALLQCDNGKANRSLDWFERANEIFEAEDYSQDLAKNLLGLSWAHGELGNLDEARKYYRKAANLFESLGEPAMVANVKRQISRTWRDEGEYHKARNSAQEALNVAVESSNRRIEAFCWNNIGEDARQRSEWFEALEAYRKARRLWQLSDDRNVVIAKINEVLSEIGKGQLTASSEQLRRLENGCKNAGYHFLLPVLHLVTAYRAAQEEKIDAWSQHFEEAKASIEKMGSIDGDIAWVSQQNASKLDKLGFNKEARRAAGLAIEQLQRLGRISKAELMADEYGVDFNPEDLDSSND